MNKIKSGSIVKYVNGDMVSVFEVISIKGDYARITPGIYGADYRTVNIDLVELV